MLAHLHSSSSRSGSLQPNEWCRLVESSRSSAAGCEKLHPERSSSSSRVAARSQFVSSSPEWRRHRDMLSCIGRWNFGARRIFQAQLVKRLYVADAVLQLLAWVRTCSQGTTTSISSLSRPVMDGRGAELQFPPTSDTAGQRRREEVLGRSCKTFQRSRNPRESASAYAGHVLSVCVEQLQCQGADGRACSPVACECGREHQDVHHLTWAGWPWTWLMCNAEPRPLSLEERDWVRACGGRPCCVPTFGKALGPVNQEFGCSRLDHCYSDAGQGQFEMTIHVSYF